MIRELKTLIAVASEGTFAAAGQKTGLTQAAVSARMQRLEEALGFALFDRSGRAARLNPRGHDTLARARELVRLHDELGARGTAAEAVESVTVGAIASIQRARLPDVLARFHRQDPKARSRVVPGLSKDLLDLVDAGELDLALVIRPPFALQRELRWADLAHEPFRLLVPASSGLRGRGGQSSHGRHDGHIGLGGRSSRSDQSSRSRAGARKDDDGQDWAAMLAAEPFIRYDHRSFGGRQVERFLRERHIAVRQIAELDELEAIVRLVANRVGIALVPEPSGQHRWPAGVRAIDLGAATFHRDIGLVHRPLGQMTASALRLARLICDAYGVITPEAGPPAPSSVSSTATKRSTSARPKDVGLTATGSRSKTPARPSRRASNRLP